MRSTRNLPSASGSKTTSHDDSVELKPTVECFSASSVLHADEGWVLGMVDASVRAGVSLRMRMLMRAWMARSVFAVKMAESRKALALFRADIGDEGRVHGQDDNGVVKHRDAFREARC